MLFRKTSKRNTCLTKIILELQLIHTYPLYAFYQALIALTKLILHASLLAGGQGQGVQGGRTGMCVPVISAIFVDALIIMWC